VINPLVMVRDPCEWCHIQSAGLKRSPAGEVRRRPSYGSASMARSNGELVCDGRACGDARRVDRYNIPQHGRSSQLGADVLALTAMGRFGTPLARALPAENP